MFAQVKFQLTGLNQTAVLIPGSALLTRKEGTQVVTVRKDGKLHFENVVVGRDFGNQVEIVSGLTAESSVVTNPTDAMQEGEAVQLHRAAKKEK